MKKVLAIVALMIMSVGAFAQSKGLTIIPFVGVSDFTKTPLNRYNTEQRVDNVNLGTEVGYFGNTFGLTGTVQSNWDLNSEALVGLKGYVKLGSIENINIHAAVGASTYVKDLKDSRWLFTPQLVFAVPMVKHFEARFAAIGNMYSHNDWKVKPAASFGIAYSL